MVELGDNTGARRAKCIHVLGGSAKSVATAGDFVILAIPRRRAVRRLATKNIYLALLVTVRRSSRRQAGFTVRFAKNKAVLLTNAGKVLGTRFRGPLDDKLRLLDLAKIINISRALV